MRALVSVFIFIYTTTSLAFAVEPNERLSDSALEARAREISKELRCLVCQNQSIDDSNAGLARDLRSLVRYRLTIGDSNEQVLSFIVDRYGQFVLLRPPFIPATLMLWLASPIIFLVGGSWIVFTYYYQYGDISQTLDLEEKVSLKHPLDRGY